MINSERNLILNACGVTACLVCATLIVGCHGLSLQPKPVNVDPVLPMSLGREELVAHINRHCRNLNSWRCLDTQIKIRMSNGLRHRLSGMIACEAPSNFRLTARNVLASADLGTNDKICWFYMKPGDAPLFMWSHNDAELLDQLNLGFPRIEPHWLMNVLGVVPLNAEDFSLSTGPAGSAELWLQAIIEKPQGQAVRRAIKVDTVTGHVREHVIYDTDRNPIIRANLSNYKTVDGNVLPTLVSLEFPRLDMEIELSFPKIEPNAMTPQNLWQMPTGTQHVVDLGHETRRRLSTASSQPTRQHANEYVSPDEQPWDPNPHADPISHSHSEPAPFASDPPGTQEDLFSDRSNTSAPPVEPEWDTPPPRQTAERPPSKFRIWPWSRQ